MRHNRILWQRVFRVAHLQKFEGGVIRLLPRPRLTKFTFDNDAMPVEASVGGITVHRPTSHTIKCHASGDATSTQTSTTRT